MSLVWLWQGVAVNAISAGMVGGFAYRFRKQTELPIAELQGAVEARRECSKRVLDIMGLCNDLEGVTNPAFQGDRERWTSQLDEATMWLTDNWQQFALTFANIRGMNKTIGLDEVGLPGLMAQYAGAVRGEWLSDRPLDQRVRRIHKLTDKIWTIFFVRNLRAAKDKPAAVRELQAMLGHELPE